MTDCIIAASDNYQWKHIKNWVLSIEKSGFKGDVVLLAYRMDDTTIQKCLQHKRITTISCNHTSWGIPINHISRNRDTQSHQMRFFHIWQYLKDLPLYRYVIATDIKDVIFQKNPIEWLEQNCEENQLIAPSEGLLYKDEPWGYDNVLQGFGPYILEDMKDKEISNVGTIAGSGKYMMEMCKFIYLLGEHNPYIPNDQSGWNIILHSGLFNIKLIPADDDWGCQIGTVADPTKMNMFRPKLLVKEPLIKDDMVVSGKTGNPYYLVHQYMRNPQYDELINQKFKED